MMNQPTLMIRDPNLIKQITIKDFEVFPEHKTVVDENVDPLWGKNLFSSRGLSRNRHKLFVTIIVNYF